MVSVPRLLPLNVDLGRSLRNFMKSATSAGFVIATPQSIFNSFIFVAHDLFPRDHTALFTSPFDRQMPRLCVTDKNLFLTSLISFLTKLIEVL